MTLKRHSRGFGRLWRNLSAHAQDVHIQEDYSEDDDLEEAQSLAFSRLSSPEAIERMRAEGRPRRVEPRPAPTVPSVPMGDVKVASRSDVRPRSAEVRPKVFSRPSSVRAPGMLFGRCSMVVGGISGHFWAQKERFSRLDPCEAGRRAWGGLPATSAATSSSPDTYLRGRLRVVEVAMETRALL